MMFGFMVVRKKDRQRAPGLAYDLPIPMVGQKYYSGYDRLPWFDQLELLDSRQATRELIAIMEPIESGLMALPLVKDEMTARRALRSAADEKHQSNEIIAVKAHALSEAEPDVGRISPGWEWLGWDVGIAREFSLVRLAYYSDDLRPFIEELANPHGLFSAPRDAKAFRRAYKKCEATHGVEPVPGEDSLILVGVWRAPEEVGREATSP